VKKLGIRLGNWLTAEQGHAFLQAPDRQRLTGKRDRALLALLLACGLRRHEAVALTSDHLRIVGKGGHVRTVPVPDWVRAELDHWLAAAAIDRGRMFRRVNKVGPAWGDGMTVKAVWHIVKESARALEWRSLRRTIFGPVLGSAKLREATWSRSIFFWGMSQGRRPNATLAASSGFDQPLMIALASSESLSWVYGCGSVADNSA
jgi:integrase